MRPLSLKRRICLGVVLLSLPMFLVSIAGVVALDATVDGFAETAEEAVDEALPLARLQAAVHLSGDRAAELIDDPGQGNRRHYEATRDEVEQAFAALDSEVTEERSLVESAHEDVREAHELVLLAMEAQARGMATAGQAAAVEGAVEVAQSKLAEAERRSVADITAEQMHAQRIQRSAILTVTACMLVGLVLAVAGGSYLVRSLIQPLRLLVEAAREIGGGALWHRIGLRRSDELGEVAAAFDVMAGRLEDSQRQLTHTALHDALTGLPNRVLLADRIEQALSRTSRGATSAALLLIDLDGFKAVNDTLGHGAGDEVLRSAAERLRLCLRPQDTAARLGGDEFALLVESDTPLHALGVGERVLQSMRPAYRREPMDVFLTASVGIAVAGPRDAMSAEELLRRADLAMYRAKHGGKDGLCVYDPMMTDAVLERMEMDAELRLALERREFVLHYQPIYTLEQEAPVAVEALVRWRHPQRGMVAPNAFIPAAEANGMILELGAWALEEACAQLRRWEDADPRAGDLTMSVNLSARQLADDTLSTSWPRR